MAIDSGWSRTRRGQPIPLPDGRGYPGSPARGRLPLIGVVFKKPPDIASEKMERYQRPALYPLSVRKRVVFRTLGNVRDTRNKPESDPGPDVRPPADTHHMR